MPTETALAQQEPAQAAVRRYALKTAAPQRKGLVDYDRDLSDEQRAVALCDPRPTLVIAGAGSGKTRALTYRVAHLIESGSPPEKLLLLTFTNKAAREMMARVGQICRIETRRMWGGTFHHVAHGLLREHASRLGYADRFGLLDREDSKEVMASATADLGYGVGQRRFPRPDALIDLYSSAINTQRPLAEVIALESPQFVALEDEILCVARRFAERKAQMNAMDFDDLLLNWKRLLVEVPAARESISRRFSAVLVDEYQDTNRLQGEIVDVTAAPHGNLLVVGDDAQSIYAFRGAHFENILKFPERHPQCQELRLLTNYRSTPPILALANASISCNRKQFQKELRCRPWCLCATCISRRSSSPSASSSCARKASGCARWRCSTGRTRTRWSCRWSWRGAGFPSWCAPACGSSSRRTSRTCSRTSSSSRTRRTSFRSSASSNWCPGSAPPARTRSGRRWSSGCAWAATRACTSTRSRSWCRPKRAPACRLSGVRCRRWWRCARSRAR